DRTIHQRHQAPQLRPLPIAWQLPKTIPIFLPPVPIIGRSMPVNHAPSRPLIPRPATSRADAPFPELRRRAADTPYSNFAPSPYAASMMQPAMRMQQPQMFGAAPMMQQPNVYTLPKNPQYDDYDKKEDLDDDYEYAKPINMGQVGLSFGVNGGGGGAAADESSSATTSAPS
uniref:Uncharacterized protein n=1 Tax=Romanomermis culicivorax TaxID=13658 RepID=A0A915JBI5_ROMCU